MIFHDITKYMRSGHRIINKMILCLFVVGVWSTVGAQQRKRVKKVADDRVHLIQADELRYDMYGPNPDAQIVKGNVSFSHQGAHLTCDSAYFYQASNSVRAFGHVRFRQGDTLSLTCDRAWYDGTDQMLEARQNVVLKHRQQTLYTDSLNYDRLYEYAYFFNGGRLIDGDSKLSSDWGEYHTNTRQARFNMDVQLITPKNRVSTDTLYYNTGNSMAHVVGMYTADRGHGEVGPSSIKGRTNAITTTAA